MNNYYVYDTSALLESIDILFKEDKNIIIPSTVLEELDKIKDQKNNLQVHKLIHLLKEHKHEYEIYIYNSKMNEEIFNLGIDVITPDMKILAVAITYDKKVHPDETIFVTNDINLQNIANLYFGEDSIIEVTPIEPEKYTGVKEVMINDTALAYFYEHLDQNIFDLKTNQYIILKNTDNVLIDKYCWTGEKHRPVSFKPIESNRLGVLKPKKNDLY